MSASNESKGKFPETISVRDPAAIDFILKGQNLYPREEWQEVAEYKLVKVRRVRWLAEWEDER